jgi:anti-anti-sigma factor
LVLALPDEIDITNSRRIGEQLASALTSGAATVVADMTATTFCDSSGARILIIACEQAAATGIRLRLAVPSDQVRHGFALMGLRLPVYPSIAAALLPD